jgi:hypothetical protein
MAHLESSKLFSVKGLVAVITGAGSGKEQTLFRGLLSLQFPPPLSLFILEETSQISSEDIFGTDVFQELGRQWHMLLMPMVPRKYL